MGILEDYIQGLYDQTEREGVLPNITKVNQQLFKILNTMFEDKELAQKQFLYLKQRIMESLKLILGDEEEDLEARIMSPSVVDININNMAKNSNLLFINNDYTHKRWVWTGRGATTRHMSNDNQIVPVNKPFLILNDETGSLSEMQYPLDPNGHPDSATICYCEMELVNLNTASKALKYCKAKKNINNTILIDTNNVYNDLEPWNLSTLGLENTYKRLKNQLPINVELTHLGKLDQDSEVFKELGYGSVAIIKDVELVNDENGYSAIRVTDSEITNNSIDGLIDEGLINGVSMNYYGNNDVDNAQGVIIESMSFVNEPACDLCTIEAASKLNNKTNDTDISIVEEVKNMDNENKQDNELLKQISDLIDSKLEDFKTEMSPIVEDKDVQETEEFVPDRFTEAAYREQLKKELEAEAAKKECEDYVYELQQKGMLGNLKPEDALKLAVADLGAFKQSMEMASKSGMFHSVIYGENVPNTVSGRALHINAGKFANR